MSKFEHFKLLVKQIKYKQFWKLRLDQDESGRMFLQWSFIGACAVTGDIETHPCRKWWLSEHMTNGEVVQTAFMAALAAEEHECREFFLYQGKRVFGPHIKLEALMEVADRIEVRT